jgi:hypothetical protein
MSFLTDVTCPLQILDFLEYVEHDHYNELYLTLLSHRFSTSEPIEQHKFDLLFLAIRKKLSSVACRESEEPGRTGRGQ